MAAVAAPVSGLVIPQPVEIVRRARAPWFIRCPPIYLVALAIVLGDALGNIGFYTPLWVAASLAVAALFLFLSRTPGVAMAMAAIAITGATTGPAHELMTPTLEKGSVRALSEGSMFTVEGRLMSEPE